MNPSTDLPQISTFIGKTSLNRYLRPSAGKRRDYLSVGRTLGNASFLYNISYLRVIMQRTNTTIIFPDAGDPNIPPIRSVF